MDSSPMTQGAGNSFLPKNMLRAVSLLKSRDRAVGGSAVNAVVKRVLVDADVRVDARRNNECLAIAYRWRGGLETDKSLCSQFCKRGDDTTVDDSDSEFWNFMSSRYKIQHTKPNDPQLRQATRPTTPASRNTIPIFL